MSRKQWLNLDDQIALFQDRGLHIDDETNCREVLKNIGYYHFSGYARFFQMRPSEGENDYVKGTSFEKIAQLQYLDAQVRQLCITHLATIEMALRASFAYHFSELVRPYGALQQESTYFQTGSKTAPAHELILENLDRSKAKFISRHRGQDGNYSDLPVWAAVEALSFGTLSKAIEFCANRDVVKALADDLVIGHEGFSSQVRSFVALRNACAHLTRVWNDVAKNPSQVPKNLLRRTKKKTGNFSSQSYFQVFVALDLFSSRINPANAFLEQFEILVGDNERYRIGIMNPTPYL